MTKKTTQFLNATMVAALALLLTTGAASARLVGPASSGPNALQPWKVVAASGQVETRLPEGLPSQWQPVARGLSLPSASWIRTGNDGRATVTQGKNVIIVDPNTELVIGVNKSAGAPTRVRQDKGSATYRIKKSGKGRQVKFQVVTPYLVAGVKGTVFRVDVFAAFASVDVTEGIVSVWSQFENEPMDVHAGDVVHLDASPGSRLEMVRERVDPSARPRPVGMGFLGKDEPVAGAEPGTEPLKTSGYTERPQEDGSGLEKEDDLDFFFDSAIEEEDKELRQIEEENLEGATGGSGGSTGGGAKTKPAQSPNN